MGISVSPQHGLNPSLLQCPLCQKDTGVALCGRLKKDAKAPHKLLDPQPCIECQKHMKQGIILVEAEPQDDHVQFYGGYWVITEEAFRRIFTGAIVDQVIRLRYTYIDPEAAKAIGLRL